MSSYSQLLLYQKRLYRSVHNELGVLESSKSKELRTYEKQYARVFRRKTRLWPLEKLQQRLSSCRVILCGDFHSFRQSQKTAIRLLRELVPTHNNLGIALECVMAEKQSVLDQFLLGKISFEKLPQLLEFNKDWPFPWEHYQDFFALAKDQKLPLIALNTNPEHADNKLSRRDSASAKIICQFLEENPGANLFVLFGDLHLSPANLPKRIKAAWGKQKIDIVTLFQNEPSLYWRLAANRAVRDTDILRLTPQQFCIINAAPWIKLQSYLDYLEGSVDNSEAPLEGSDLQSQVIKLAEHLIAVLALEPGLESDFTVYTQENLPYLRKLLRGKDYTRSQIRQINYAFLLHASLWLSQDSILYLPVRNQNFLAESALYLLRHSKLGRNAFDPDPWGNFSGLTLLYARAYLASKLVNPKRKCNEVGDIHAYLKDKKRKLLSFERFKRGSFLWADRSLKMFLKPSPRLFHPDSQKFRTAHGLEAARLVGSILGERLAYSFTENTLSLAELRDFLMHQEEDAEAANIFIKKWFKRLQKLPYPFESKHERL